MAYVPPHLRVKSKKTQDNKESYKDAFPELSISNKLSPVKMDKNISYTSAAKMALIEIEPEKNDEEVLPIGWIKLDKKSYLSKKTEKIETETSNETPEENTMTKEEIHLYYQKALQPLVNKWDRELQAYIDVNGHHPEAYYECKDLPIEDDYYMSESDSEDESDSDVYVDSDGEMTNDFDLIDKRFMSI